MLTLGYRDQRTLAHSVHLSGLGLISGSEVTIWLRPAPPGTGVQFVRTDTPGKCAISARVENVSGTARRTTLGTAPLQVTLVEHVLSALAGLRVDNCLVELDGPEPPGFDGSAWNFVQAIRQAGIVGQGKPRPILGVSKPISVAVGGASLTLHPTEELGLTVSYMLSYGDFAPIPPMRYTTPIDPDTYTTEIAKARTFLLEDEAHRMVASGVGRHLKPTDVLIFGPHGLLAGNVLHQADEPARHKILDLIGDLSLLGVDISGRIIGYRSGHELNVELARVLAAQAGRVLDRYRQVA